jgi:hypothetical protein
MKDENDGSIRTFSHGGLSKMKKAILMVIGVAAVSGSVFAQTSTTTGLSVRLGAFMPSEKAAKDEGKSWLAAGAEFKLKDLNIGTMSEDYKASLSVSLDYYGRGDFRNVPLLLNYTGRKNQFYYTAGAGVGFSRLPSGTGSVDKTRFAYQVGVGYDFAKGSTPVFVEAKYFGAQKKELAGIGLFVGVRL